MTSKQKFTILVVDDERSNIVDLSNILRPLYVVLAAKDGPSAIEVAQSARPDLILLDIIMPGMSGFEALTELKHNDATKDIPVIIVTGLNNSKDEEKGLLLGAVDYIAKPFDSAVVKLRVKTHLKILEQMRIIEGYSMIDHLTNLPNRRSLDNRLAFEWNSAIRNNTPLGAMMIDIDNFKGFNDSYGHMSGDEALKTVANIISQKIKRSVDFVARWGGEEFAVLLPFTDLNGAVKVAERIREHIANKIIFCADGQKTHITVSIGVNSGLPSADMKMDDVFLNADKALYVAKDAGKNVVKTV